MSILIRRFQN